MTAFRRKKEEEGRRKKEDGRRKKKEEEEREVQCVSNGVQRKKDILSLHSLLVYYKSIFFLIYITTF